MAVLVTGAGGFLGSHLIRELSVRGRKVKAMVRRKNQKDLFDLPGVETVYGDIKEPATLTTPLKDIETVFNCAALVSEWGKKKKFYSTNVYGTKNLLEASKNAGVNRFIHISSLVVIGISTKHYNSDESRPYTKKVFDPYSETKIHSEKVVREYHHTSGLQTTILRPSVIWGPGDRNIFPRLFQIMNNGTFFLINGGRQTISLTYVDNLVEAMLLAEQREEAKGEIYHIVDGWKCTFKEFLNRLLEKAEKKPVSRSVPFTLAYLIAYLTEVKAKLLHEENPPLLTRFGLYLMSNNSEFDCSKAQRELNYSARVGLEEGLEKTAAWIKKEKLLK
ncbi:MAG: NAD-dependent epimerase/dehydratase family protein [Thermodesulfobacteriota bacterium]|nr:NAD-dependent epimerase/dehydratase family protein [Thermodesulfobacteriota bacterium]